MRAKCNDLSVLSKSYTNGSVNERQYGASRIPRYSSPSSDQRLVQSNQQEFTENSFVGAVNDMRHRHEESFLCFQRHAQIPSQTSANMEPQQVRSNSLSAMFKGCFHYMYRNARRTASFALSRRSHLQQTYTKYIRSVRRQFFWLCSCE